MSGFDRIAEEKIRKAMEAGEFDRLAGKGKPLKLQNQPFEPEDMGTVFRLLKNNGLTLPWIEQGMEIERKRQLAHRLLRQICLAAADGEDCCAALDLFNQQIDILNREIHQYNLRVPGTVFQRNLLDPNAERTEALSGRLASDAVESRT